MEVLVAPPATGLFVAFVAYLAIVNLMTVGLFAADKRRAVKGVRRIPETTLLLAAFLGGSPGAKWAQRSYRHKTRKQPFARLLNAVVVLHVLFAAAVPVPAA